MKCEGAKYTTGADGGEAGKPVSPVTEFSFDQISGEKPGDTIKRADAALNSQPSVKQSPSTSAAKWHTIGCN